eukprot:875726-Pelagomonas_calceolata.AAC.1
MLLPASGRHLITNPYSELLNAFPHLCYKLGTIPKSRLIYGNPQSWPGQEIALPQHTCDLQIIAVWNTTARAHLNNQSPIWLRDLAKDIPEAKWYVKCVSNNPILNARHAIMPGIGKREKLPLDKKQIAKVSHKPAADITAPTPCRPTQTSSSKL